MKKLLSVILSAVVLLSAFPLAAQAAPADEGVEGRIETVFGDGQEPEPTEAVLPTESETIPEIALSFDNTAEGTKIVWTAVDGAAAYALYVKEDEADALLAETGELSFIHTPLEDGNAYSYTVKALDENGEVIIEAAEENLFIAPPVIERIAGTADGVTLSWTPRAAESYRVYRKTDQTGWSRIADTEDTSFTDLTAVSGVRYTYTVRCLSADSKRFISYFTGGRAIDYVRTPSITSIDNTATGAKVTWQKPTGAVTCRLYYKNGSTWTYLTETDGNSYVHDNLEDGATYIYTVRALNGNRQFSSDFNREGWSNTFIAPPVITSFTNTDKGIEIRWNRCEGAENYRLYYYGSRGWTALTTTSETSYLDTDVASGGNYTYTVRCISADNKRFMSYFNSGKRTQYVGVPTISSIENTAAGAKLTWQKPAGAEKVRVYVKSGSSWSRLTETTGTSYVHDNLNDNTEYTYTIRAINANGGFASDFNREGWSNTFFAAPVIRTIDNKTDGVTLTWDNPGANTFCVYRKTDSSAWTRLTRTAENTFTDTTAQSGVKYTYTLRMLDKNNQFCTAFLSGKSITYVAAPVITGFSSAEDGAVITWDEVPGAYSYRLYYQNESGGWTRLATVAGTEYTDTSVESGKVRVYTIRCMNSSGGFASDFDREGWGNTFIAPPTISSVTRQGSSNVITWEKADGIAAYRLYRKHVGESWARLFDSTTATSYTDTTALNNKAYAYTLRYLDADGNVVSPYLDNVPFYVNGVRPNGNIADGGTYGFDNGYLLIGFNRVNGMLRCYNRSGRMYRNTIVGTTATGYYYTDNDGICCETEEMCLAAEYIMTYCQGDNLQEKAKFAFLHMARNYPYERVYNDTPNSEKDIPPFAIELFTLHKGTCYRYAAAYACVMKIAGYRSRFCYGLSGVMPHGWTEVYVDGHWMHCDVDAQLPGYNFPDYYPYMTKEHVWILDKKWYSELIVKDGKATWGKKTSY